MLRKLVLLLVIAVSTSAGASTFQCGGYTLELIPDALFKINGQTVDSQRIKDLGETGMMVKMDLMPARDGNNYAFQYIHHPGSSARFLNVQLLQTSMDAPRIIGSFPCVKVGS